MASQVAETILQQLGGKMFAMITGARQFVASETSLTFKLPTKGNRVNCVRVTLDATDTYTVEALLIKGSADVRVIGTRDLVYCDQLVDVFESLTGLYASLTRRAL